MCIYIHTNLNINSIIKDVLNDIKWLINKDICFFKYFFNYPILDYV